VAAPTDKLLAALVVDDDEALLSTTVAVLEHAFEVHTAHTAAEALAIVARQPVDVVISDLHMLGMDGLALLTHLRKRPVPPGLVLVTGDLEGARGALGTGVAVLHKPAAPSELLRVAKRLAEESAAARAKARPPR
jgi:CheY-like chemotaxis protein